MPQNDADDRRKVDYATIVGTAGSIAPWKISAILTLGATVADLEEAVAWISVEQDGSGLHHASSTDIVRDSKAAAIFEILSADRAESSDD